jgi:hypothetical protein
MKIFPTQSPVDRVFERPERPHVHSPRGRLSYLIDRSTPLLKAKKTLDKVYSNGYFETHYPDADKTLKGLLHERAMDAWSHAEHFCHDDEEKEEKEEKKKSINVVINLGT